MTRKPLLHAALALLIAVLSAWVIPNATNQAAQLCNTLPLCAADSGLIQFTQGTTAASELPLGEVTSRSGHGVRIYCPVAGWGYFDPVIFPNQPNKSHLHLFIGNTDISPFSTSNSLRESGGSSCEGGIHSRSSYWMPALFNGEGELVVPESAWIYYKTFSGPDFNYDQIQTVPNGLQMLASDATLNASGQIKFETKTHDGKPTLKFSMQFPNCVATGSGDSTGEPVLTFRELSRRPASDDASEVNSHVAYSGGPDATANGCPASHPYRLPTMTLMVTYDPTVAGDDWYLSSDVEQGVEQGQSLHADYIAAWDSATMDTITQCNQEARSCNFDAGRSGLPERLSSPEGEPLYKYSHVLHEHVDRTPFGNQFGAMPGS